MKNISLTVIVALLGLFSYPALAADDPIARQKGVDAFWLVEKWSWHTHSMQKAAELIQEGLLRNQEEPWLMIAQAKLMLRTEELYEGRISQETLLKATEQARRAAEIAPKDPIVQTYYANRLYQGGKNEEAWAILQQVMAASPGHPYPIYATAQKIIDARDPKSLKIWLEKGKAADPEGRYDYFYRVLKMSLCEQEQNWPCVETMHQETIAAEPQNPWAHGDYAGFLENAKRFKEAKVSYERALELMNYSRARVGLERVNHTLEMMNKGSPAE